MDICICIERFFFSGPTTQIKVNSAVRAYEKIDRFCYDVKYKCMVDVLSAELWYVFISLDVTWLGVIWAQEIPN